MVAALLDSSILIDILRFNLPAQTWLTQQQSRLGVTPIVWLELIHGAANKQAQNQAVILLKRFERIQLIDDDYEWAIQNALHYRLSHNIGSNDCLIASVSYRLQVPLYTTNLKHFTPLLGGLAQKPY